MKKYIIAILTVMVVLLSMPATVFALKGRLATADDIKLLKRDVLQGKIKIGKTRLKKIRDLYGDANNINETDSRITYNYGDLRLVMDKIKYLRKWEYDYSQGIAYTDDIDSLRSDLEDKQIIGDFVSYDLIRSDYGEPTKAYETAEDGKKSIYYYGEIKLIFENVIVVNSWRGSSLQEGLSAGVISDGVLGAGLSSDE